MANSRIKGITIEIGGNTTKLQDALKDVDKKVYNLNKDLSGLNDALKIDPKNTDLLAQKYDVLSRNISNTKNRIDTLKEAQAQMGDYNSLTEEQKDNYNALSIEIAKAEKKLEDMNNELKNTNKVDLTKLVNTLKKVGDVAVQVAKKMAQVTAAIGGALASLVGLGVKSYAEFEQVNQGAKLLWGDAYGYIEEQSKKAYATMGLSANDYLKQVNGLAVSLKSSMGGNAKAAAELANKVLVAESDIVAATGATQESVQNAFNGIMKGNYSMLDNLQLGIKPTKAGMQEVIDKVNEWNKAQGHATKYQMGNYADMQAALVDYVKMKDLEGYAAREASETVTGSISAMKAAFTNFLTGTGSPEELSKTIVDVFTNIAKVINDLAPHILSGVVTLIQTVLPQIVTTITGMLPQLLDAITNLINSLFNMVAQNTEKIRETTTLLINKFVEFVTTNLPTIINLALTLIITLAQGIADALKNPEFIQSIVNCVLEIVNIITDNLDLVIDVALQLILALTDGLLIALPQLAEKVPEIVDKIVDVIMNNLPKILQAALYIIVELAKGLILNLPTLMKNVYIIPQKIFEWIKNKKNDILNAGKDILANLISGLFANIDNLKTKAGEIVGKLKDWLVGAVGKMTSAGKDLIAGMWKGITEKWDSLKDKVKSFGDGVVGKFKKVFGIGSPSKVFEKEIGRWLAEGIDVGFTETMEDVTQDMTNAIPVNQLASNVSTALRSLNSGIESSLNPTINPTIAYENNYKMMAEVFKEALGEMKVELDDREMGKFIDQTVVNEVFS